MFIDELTYALTFASDEAKPKRKWFRFFFKAAALGVLGVGIWYLGYRMGLGR